MNKGRGGMEAAQEAGKVGKGKRSRNGGVSHISGSTTEKDC